MGKLLNYLGQSKILKRIADVLNVTDVKVNDASVVDNQGVAEITVPVKISDLPNDAGFITNAVNDLANYYLKTETYTQAEVNALIGAITTISFLVVQTLPQTGEANIIYLVPKNPAQTDNIYDEYIWVTNDWEKIGDTEIDLSNYYTKTESDARYSQTDDKVTQTNTSNNAYYRVLLSGTNDNTTRTEGARKSGNILFNPSNSAFQVRATGSTSSETPDTEIYSQIIFTNFNTDNDTSYSAQSTIRAYHDHQKTSTAGNNLVINSGTGLFIGAGEGASSHYNEVGKANTAENMYITSDSNVHIQANGQTIANRKGMQVTTNGNVVPEVADVSTDNSGGIGTANSRWADGYFVNINGEEVGNSPKFTDEKVKQTAMGTDAKEYRVLLTTNDTNTEETDILRKCSALTFKPSNGQLKLARVHTSTSNTNENFIIGNDIPSGTAGNVTGVLRLFGKSTYYGQFGDSGNILTGDRTYGLPNKNGLLALTSNDVTSNVVDWESNGRLGTKNLNSTPYYYAARTINGITWTINSDGTVTANGTATARSTFVMHSHSNLTNALILPNGDYIISGCPSGGSSATYYMALGRTSGGAYSGIGSEYGNGRTIALNGDDFSNTEVRVHLALVIANGQTVNNLVFKPMIRLAEDDDATYRPYAMTNRELTEIVQSKGEWVDLGSFTVGYIPDIYSEIMFEFRLTDTDRNVTDSLLIHIPTIAISSSTALYCKSGGVLGDQLNVNSYYVTVACSRHDDIIDVSQSSIGRIKGENAYTHTTKLYAKR